MKNPETKTTDISATGDLFDTIEAFLEKNRRIILGICILVTTGLCYLLFDARLSFATDDAEYIKRAYGFALVGAYPSYQGSLYPIFLALLIKIVGFHVPVFKLFSSLLIIGSNAFFYKAFKGKVPYLVLFTVLIYLSINSYYLYFASQTFTEAFVLFIEAVGFVFFLQHLKTLESKPTIGQSWKSWLMFGLFLFLLSITKNILILGVGSAVIYFLIYKEWLNAGLSILFFGIFKVPYELMTKYVFHVAPTAQLDQAMRIDFYDPNKGYEDFPTGYIDRFFENFNAFISVQVFKVLGLRPEHLGAKTTDEASFILTLIFAAAVVFAFITLYRKNRFLVFALLYALIVWIFSFTALQTMWNDQWRLILPYTPYVLIAILGAFWFRAKAAKQSFFKPLLAAGMVVLILIQFPLTSDKVSANSRGLKHYIKGDMKYGVPEQWVDFVNVCDSIKAKVPADAMIATGKPGEASVYAGFNNFQRIAMPGKDESADSVLADLKKQKITYLFMDGFSRQVTTAAQIIQKKYPEKLEPVLQSASNPEQPIYLIKIKY